MIDIEGPIERHAAPFGGMRSPASSLTRWSTTRSNGHAPSAGQELREPGTLRAFALISRPSHLPDADQSTHPTLVDEHRVERQRLECATGRLRDQHLWGVIDDETFRRPHSMYAAGRPPSRKASGASSATRRVDAMRLFQQY